MRCHSCGVEVAFGHFCTQCGQPLDGVDAVVETGSTEADRRGIEAADFLLRDLESYTGRAGLSREDSESARWTLTAHRDRLERRLVQSLVSLPVDQSTPSLKEFVSSFPHSAAPRLELGQLYEQAGRYEDAVNQYSLAASSVPGQPEPHLLLARLYDRRGLETEALYEYSTYLVFEEQRFKRMAVAARVRELEAALLSEEEKGGTGLEETPEGIRRLLSVIRADLRDPTGAVGRLADAYSGRPREPIASAARQPPPLTPRPTPASREPVNWEAFWAALFSERTLAALLVFGVLLVAVSSLALLVTGWSTFPDWLRQLFLAGQLAIFLAVGHFVKEKIGLHLSGLALVSVAAIWVPINVGTLVFELLEAPGEAVLPGLELPLDLPMHGWLIIAASCVPTWAALAFRYRGHLLTHGTIAATGATVALAVAVFGGSWEWRISSIAVLVPLLVPARRRLMGTSFRPNAAPLYYTAQAALALTGAVLVAGYIMGEANGHSVTVAALAGTAVYLLANRVTPRLAREYPIAVLPVVGLLFSTAEQGLDGRYFEALLLMVAVVYVAAGRMREGGYQTGILRSSAWPALQPAYAVGVVAAALAAAGPAVDRLNAVACWTALVSCDGGIAWPDTEPVVRIAVLYAAAAVSAVLARWWGRLLWSALSGAPLFAAFLLSLDQIDILPVDYQPVAVGLLSCAYLTLGVYVRRSVHGVSMLLWALAAALVAVFWALSTNEPAVLSVALPPTLVVFAAGSVMIQRRQLETATTWLAKVPANRRIEEVADTAAGRDVVRRRLSAALLGFAGVLLPVWTTYLVRWAGIPDDWSAGVDILAAAAAAGYLSYRLSRRGLPAHAAVLSALCVLLAVAAPVFHIAAQDLTWTLAGLLFGDVALAAIAAYVLQRPNLAYAALLLLPVPYALILDLAGLDIPYSAVYWGVLSAAYFAVAVLLLRRPVFSSIPVFAAGHAIGVVSLALATHGLVEGGGLGAANAAYLVHAGLLAALAYLLRSQWYGLGAALLFTMPYTLTLYDQYGESPELFALPSGALAYGWIGLAIVYVAAGPIMERVLPRRWGVLPLAGYLLLAGAAFAAIDGVEARRVVYGAIAVAAAASASLTHSGLASGLVDQASKGLRLDADRVREWLTLTYMAVAAVLTPLWVIEMLSLSTTERAAQGLTLALLTPLYAAGALIVRRWAGWLYTAPLHAAMLGVSVYGAAAAYEDETLRTVSLLTVTVAYAIVLAGHRRPVFVYPLLLAGHLTLSSVLVLSDLNLSLQVMGVLFTPAAIVMAGLAGRQLLPVGNAFITTNIWKFWATPFLLFAVVDVGASIVLAAREDWAGLAVTLVYAVATALAATYGRVRMLAYVSTVFAGGVAIFASRLFGLDWSEVAVVWAMQGLLMWWAARAFGGLSRHPRLAGAARERFTVWTAPLRSSGTRLSWLALGFVVATYFVRLADPERFGLEQLDDVTAVLAVLGLLYLGLAFTSRRPVIGYLAVGLLLASWILQLVDLEVPFAQLYAVPAGLYLMGISFFERRRASVELAAFTELGAVLLLVVSSFMQSVVEEPGWPYAILLGFESVFLVLWGSASGTRLAFIGGVVAFTANVLYQTTGLLSSLPGATVGLIVGLVLVSLIAGIEWRRNQLIVAAREWTTRFNRWTW